MAQGGFLQAFPSFEAHGDPFTVGQKWEQWIGRFEVFLKAVNIKDDERKRAMLLYYAGEETHKIFNTLDDTGDDKNYTKAKQALHKRFKPESTSEYPIYMFRRARQQDSETMDDYHTRLRQLADHCDFTDMDKEIKSQIVQGCKSSRIRRRVLKDGALTLPETGRR